MNNELFDSIIREQLAQSTITPSAGVKKTLTQKMFFKNLWFFHKIKLLMAFCIVAGSASTIYILNTNKSLSNSNIEYITYTPNNIENTNIYLFDDNFSYPSFIPNNVKASIRSTLQVNGNFTIDNEDTTPNHTNSLMDSQNSSNQTYIIESKEIENTQKLTQKKSTKHKSNIEKLHETSLDEVSIEKNTYIEVQDLRSQKWLNSLLIDPIPSQEVLLDLAKDNNQDPLLLGKEKPYVYKELSFDMYSIIHNNGLIVNEMQHENYSRFYWDFYANQTQRKMPTSFGLGVNYAVGTYRHKFMFSGGLNYTAIEESKTKYDFNVMMNQEWLNLLGVSEYSWVNTYGQDTCTTCFFASDSDEMRQQIQKDYNKYTYTNIPIQAGYQLNLGKLTVAVKGGVQASILTKAKGLHVKKSNSIEGEELYFWKGIEMATLSRQNEMLKSLHLSYMVGADARLRLSSSLDLMVGYSMIQSVGAITKDNYFFSKKYSNNVVQLGLSYFPKRIPVIKKSKIF